MKRDEIEALKHNAKLDVRLPDQLKDEFLARCWEEGVSSGAVIRSLLIDYVKTRPRPVLAWLDQLKEMIVRRSKWIMGGIGGGAATVFAATSLILAPAATAETVSLDVEMDIDDGVEPFAFEASHVTSLGEGWMVFPTNTAGEPSYALTVFVRACGGDDHVPEDGCDVTFDIEVFEVLDFHYNDLGGVSVTNKRIVATPVITGRFGDVMSYITTIEENGATFSLTTRAVVTGE